MIAARLLNRIETNWESIARKVILARDSDPNLLHYRDLSDDEIRNRVRDLTTHLALWLTDNNPSALSAHFEHLGRQRFQQGVPLHQLLRKISTIRQAIRTYASEQNLSLTAVEIYEELELLRAMSNYFDFVVFHVTKGYEDSMANQASRAA
jgi:hypothetical protein